MMNHHQCIRRYLGLFNSILDNMALLLNHNSFHFPIRVVLVWKIMADTSSCHCVRKDPQLTSGLLRVDDESQFPPISRKRMHVTIQFLIICIASVYT